MKLGGYHHFSRQAFPFEDCWPLARAVHEHFGARRLLWGSDYPHVTLAGGYGENLRQMEEGISGWPVADREAVLGGNAARLYWPDG